jgi:Tfp pilus assembly protein PilX
MNQRLTNKKSESGVALIVTLLAILVLSILGAAIIIATQSQTWTALNYRQTAQARYAAEAGLQKTMNWLNGGGYTAHGSFGSYDMTKNPVQYSGQPVVLSYSSANSNYPDSTVKSNATTALTGALPGLSNVSYSATATLLRMSATSGISWLGGSGGAVQTWQITSTGTVSGGVRNASVQVTQTFEKTTGGPIFNYAVAATGTGCKAIDFNGTDSSDSYNSSIGYYNQTVGGTANKGSQGNLATNGNVYLGSSAVINGTISDTSVTTSGACASGSVTAVTNSGGSYLGSPNPTKLASTALNYQAPWGCGATTPCYPVSSPNTTAQAITSAGCASVPGCSSSGTTSVLDNGKSTTANVFSLAPGTNYGNLTIDNADVVHVSAGTYDINSLNFAKDGQLVVDSGPVVLNVSGKGYAAGSVVINSGGLSGWNLCSGGVTGAVGPYGTAGCGGTAGKITGIPSNLQIVYAGPATISTTGAPCSSAIYAPNAYVNTVGGAVGLYGAIISNTFLESSKAPVHYDTALGNLTQVGQYRPVGGFSWSKF